MKWTSFTGFVSASPSVGSDGTVYVGTRFVFAFRSDGSQMWNFTVNCCEGFGGPAIGPDGTIYAGGDRGLYALRPD